MNTVAHPAVVRTTKTRVLFDATRPHNGRLARFGAGLVPEIEPPTLAQRYAVVADALDPHIAALKRPTLDQHVRDARRLMEEIELADPRDAGTILALSRLLTATLHNVFRLDPDMAAELTCEAEFTGTCDPTAWPPWADAERWELGPEPDAATSSTTAPGSLGTSVPTVSPTSPPRGTRSRLDGPSEDDRAWAEAHLNAACGDYCLV